MEDTQRKRGPWRETGEVCVLCVQGSQAPALSGSQVEVHEDRSGGSRLGLGRLVCRRHQALHFSFTSLRWGNERKRCWGTQRRLGWHVLWQRVSDRLLAREGVAVAFGMGRSKQCQGVPRKTHESLK